MIVLCPSCQAKYNVPDDRVGVKFYCKKCNAIVRAGEKKTKPEAKEAASSNSVQEALKRARSSIRQKRVKQLRGMTREAAGGTPPMAPPKPREAAPPAPPAQARPSLSATASLPPPPLKATTPLPELPTAKPEAPAPAKPASGSTAPLPPLPGVSPAAPVKTKDDPVSTGARTAPLPPLPSAAFAAQEADVVEPPAPEEKPAPVVLDQAEDGAVLEEKTAPSDLEIEIEPVAMDSDAPAEHAVVEEPAAEQSDAVVEEEPLSEAEESVAQDEDALVLEEETAPPAPEVAVEPVSMELDVPVEEPVAADAVAEEEPIPPSLSALDTSDGRDEEALVLEEEADLSEPEVAVEPLAMEPELAVEEPVVEEPVVEAAAVELDLPEVDEPLSLDEEASELEMAPAAPELDLAEPTMQDVEVEDVEVETVPVDEVAPVATETEPTDPAPAVADLPVADLAGVDEEATVPGDELVLLAPSVGLEQEDAVAETPTVSPPALPPLTTGAKSEPPTASVEDSYLDAVSDPVVESFDTVVPDDMVDDDVVEEVAIESTDLPEAVEEEVADAVEEGMAEAPAAAVVEPDAILLATLVEDHLEVEVDLDAMPGVLVEEAAFAADDAVLEVAAPDRTLLSYCTGCYAHYRLPASYDGRTNLRCALCRASIAVLGADGGYPSIPDRAVLTARYAEDEDEVEIPDLASILLPDEDVPDAVEGAGAPEVELDDFQDEPLAGNAETESSVHDEDLDGVEDFEEPETFDDFEEVEDLHDEEEPEEVDLDDIEEFEELEELDDLEDLDDKPSR